MPRVINIANNQTFGHSCGSITTCIDASNDVVTSMGNNVVVAGDQFVPHSYCGVDGTHPPMLLPSIPNVTVKGKPIGSELSFTSCGDLVLAVGAGKVFVGDPVGSRRSLGGGPADPEEKVTLGGYPKLDYPPGTIFGDYTSRSAGREPIANTTPTRYTNLYDWTLSTVSFTATPKPTNAYVDINITDSEGKITTAQNYPGPPITSRSGCTTQLPPYAWILQEPIKIIFRMSNKLRVYRKTQGSSQYTYIREINNPLTINEDTGEVSNAEGFRGLLFSQSALKTSTISPIYDRVEIDYYAGFEFFGQNFYPETPSAEQVKTAVYNVAIK